MKIKFRLIFLSLAFSLLAGTAHADILGAAVGGLIGSQFGQGNGKIAMAALGAVVGDRISEHARTPNYAEEPYYAPQPRQYQRPYSNYEAYPAPMYQPPVRVMVYPSYPTYYANYPRYDRHPPGVARGWGRHHH